MLVNRSIRFGFPVYNKSHCRFKYKWIQPEGYNTGIKIHNPLVKGKVPLIFPNKHVVKWYICGPTVYDVSHIGHASCYIRFDIIRRILEEYFDIKPIIALGVTDVARNINLKARELGISPSDVVQMYESEFFTQMKTLNILPPHFKLKVSHNISKIKNFINVLKEKQLAFERDDDIVFKIASDKNYGRFQSPVERRTITDLEFSLWRKDAPGWHVECSAMASSVFGSSIDIHSGGADLTFPHHENEEALSTCYHECDQWVNYWVHTGLITVDDEKMSKSLGNLISVKDFLENNTSDHLRLFCLMNPYRSNLVYNQGVISQSAKLCDRILKFLQLSDLYVQGHYTRGNIEEAELIQHIARAECKIKEALKNDFGTTEVLKEIIELVKKTTKMLGNEKTNETSARSSATVASVNIFVKNFFKSFGFSFAEPRTESACTIERIIDIAVNFRSSVRSKALHITPRSTLLNHCDMFRQHFLKLGITMFDIDSNTYWTQTGSQKGNKTILNDIIDSLVGFRGSVLNCISDHMEDTKWGLEQECRALQLYLAGLGIVLKDEKRSYKWSFPKPNDLNSVKFNMIVKSALKFYHRVEDIAQSMNEESEETKNELLRVVECSLLELKSLGVSGRKNDEDNWTMDENNTKGDSLLQIVIDIFIYAFNSVKSLKFVCYDAKVKEFNEINAASKKSLALRGFIISERNVTVLTTWKFLGDISSKILLVMIIEETVLYINRLKENVRNEKDLHLKNTVLSIHDSVIKDLEEIGVIVHTNNLKYFWMFKTYERITPVQAPEEMKSLYCSFEPLINSK